MRIFSLLYNTFLWAIAFAIALFQVTWLEMRVNIGWVLFLLWALLFMCSFVKGWRFGQIGTTLNLVDVLGFCFLILGWERLFAVPALIIREGLGLNRIPVDKINFVLTCILIIGLFSVVICDKYAAKRRIKNGT
jgi:hypothetical protein